MIVIVALIRSPNETSARISLPSASFARHEIRMWRCLDLHVGPQRQPRHVNNRVRNVRDREASLDEVNPGGLSLHRRSKSRSVSRGKWK